MKISLLVLSDTKCVKEIHNKGIKLVAIPDIGLRKSTKSNTYLHGKELNTFIQSAHTKKPVVNEVCMTRKSHVF